MVIPAVLVNAVWWHTLENHNVQAVSGRNDDGNLPIQLLWESGGEPADKDSSVPDTSLVSRAMQLAYVQNKVLAGSR